MIIKGLNFINTSEFCPEQYDVKDKNGNRVAYVRLRFECLRCSVPDCGGKEIYRHYFDYEFQGSFANDVERDYYLNTIANKILENTEVEK